MPLFANELVNTIGMVELMPGSLAEIFDYAKLTTFLDSLEDWKNGELELKCRCLKRRDLID